ncbi:MAG: hypothetical protein IJQ59_01545 [Bacteroidaceae bacterium]|nr:hypothetical protein [Bacteroidaceae bacterium]
MRIVNRSLAVSTFLLAFDCAVTIGVAAEPVMPSAAILPSGICCLLTAFLELPHPVTKATVAPAMNIAVKNFLIISI